METLENKIGWKFDNTYSKLSDRLISKISPTPVKDPELVIFNHQLSNKLGLEFSKIEKDEMAMLFSGNKLPKGSETIAQAYAGHQFGHFTILGDGRAITIGEHLDKNDNRYDLQFKGSGKTPYSRNADGRAALGPMLREYLISEAMHILGIPTSRSLAVVKTGENVVREKILEGAILTRVASSHIRVGTFQYACLSKDKSDLKSLMDYSINRHYPNLKKDKLIAIKLLRIVQEKQIELICNWMRVGFIHGVMNTDNMAISGETIDYGPCAFMDHYDPNTVFSSIDMHGRYSYFNQPSIARWNLEKFAEALIPLIDNESNKAIELAKNILLEFEKKFKKSWLKMMRNKLGLLNDKAEDEQLIFELLSWMRQNKVDYTNTFCFLMNELHQKNDIYNKEDFIFWKKKWDTRKKLENEKIRSLQLMKENNPLVIPRNYLVEDALNEAVNKNNLNKINELLKVLNKPLEDIPTLTKYQYVPKFGEKKYVTFCGT